MKTKELVDRLGITREKTAKFALQALALEHLLKEKGVGAYRGTKYEAKVMLVAGSPPRKEVWVYSRASKRRGKLRG